MNMEYNEENIVTEVFCPLVDEIIEDIDCIEIEILLTVVSKCHVYLKSIKQKKILKRYANNANGTVINKVH